MFTVTRQRVDLPQGPSSQFLRILDTVEYGEHRAQLADSISRETLYDPFPIKPLERFGTEAANSQSSL
jgi:hypothetical protein